MMKNNTKHDKKIIKSSQNETTFSQGNNFVKEGKWDKAITCYTTAIKHHAYDPIYYANRALCYLKMNK